MSATAALNQEASVWGEYFSLNAWVLFAFSCVSYALVLHIQQKYVLTEQVYYNTLGEQLTIERIDAFIDKQNTWTWLRYFFIPVTLLFQTFLVSICLATGAILLDYKLKFSAIFGIVVKASVIYAIGKLVYMMVVQFMDIQTIEDLMKADVFSLLGWTGAENVPTWLQYPLSVVNVFELGFWLLLAGGMGYLLQKHWTRMINFVTVTYGVGLVVWVLLIVFLQLNLQ